MFHHILKTTSIYFRKFNVIVWCKSTCWGENSRVIRYSLTTWTKNGQAHSSQWRSNTMNIKGTCSLAWRIESYFFEKWQCPASKSTSATFIPYKSLPFSHSTVKGKPTTIFSQQSEWRRRTGFSLYIDCNCFSLLVCLSSHPSLFFPCFRQVSTAQGHCS